MLKDVRAETEQQIYMQLQTKIDEFLSLATYDWLLAESDGTASPYLVDLIYFLNRWVAGVEMDGGGHWVVDFRFNVRWCLWTGLVCLHFK